MLYICYVLLLYWFLCSNESVLVCIWWCLVNCDCNWTFG